MKAEIEAFINRGGPDPNGIQEFLLFLNWIEKEIAAQRISFKEIHQTLRQLGRPFSTETMQGFALSKPYGYSGDFEIIEHIYDQKTSADPNLKNWDTFFHSQSGTRAVRNRKQYFSDLVKDRLQKNESIRVLNVACGGGREVIDCINSISEEDRRRIKFHGIDAEPKAIDVVKKRIQKQKIQDIFTVERANVVKYFFSEKYDLIWSAGLFDYFRDSTFTKVIRRLYSGLSPSGELVIGNFSENNPSRTYIEVFTDWFLYHRSREDLKSLANAAGLQNCCINVQQEQEGVILFLHLLKRQQGGI